MTITGATAGQYTNTTGAVTSTEGGTGNTASANLTVVAPPSIAKAFSPTLIPVNTTTSLTFTITNPAANGTTALTGVGFTDTLPTGLTVPNSSATVCGGTLTLTAPNMINLAGATVNGNNAQCQFSVTVTGATAGQYTNTTGAVTSTNGGTGNTASANLTVASPPSIAKAFNPNSIPVNQQSNLQFTITNPNASIALTGVGFTDTLPSGVTVATSSGAQCGGTLTTGSGSISLTGATVAGGGNCQFTVQVTGATVGVKNNVTGNVTSVEGGNGNTASATLTVVSPPFFSKSFNPNSIPLNGTTSLQFTIQNPNGSSLTGVGFTDNLPSGVTVASSTATVCGGTLTTTSPSTIGLVGATVAGSGQCQFSVTVTGTTAGQFTNTTGVVMSTEGGNGSTATANLTVVAPPQIAKAFSPSTVAVNGTSSLMFTLTNPSANSVAETGVAFTDVLPAGLTVANTTASICGGTLSITGNNTISLTGATIGVAGQCNFSVTVTVTTAGNFTNVTGSVSSTNGGTGNTATATLSSGGSLGGSYGLRSGPINARQWIINIGNGSGAPANNPQVTNLVLTQTFGASCTPVITSTFPVAAAPNPIPTGGTGQATVTIDFSNCTGRVFFKAVTSVAADGGAVTGTITALNQLP